MELFQEIVISALDRGEVKLTLSKEAEAFVESACYRALEKIKAVIRDDSLSDPECFARIEEIVCTLEEIGSGGGFRHDFG